VDVTDVMWTSIIPPAAAAAE